MMQVLERVVPKLSPTTSFGDIWRGRAIEVSVIHIYILQTLQICEFSSSSKAEAGCTRGGMTSWSLYMFHSHLKVR